MAQRISRQQRLHAVDRALALLRRSRSIGRSALRSGSISTVALARPRFQNNSLWSSSRAPKDGVTSAPEAVVGRAMMGSLGRTRLGISTLAGGVKRVAWSASRPPSASNMASALAASDTLPPPTATMPSQANPARSAATACTHCTLPWVGTSP